MRPALIAARHRREARRRHYPVGGRGHYLWTAYEGIDAVGVLWLHLQEKFDGLHAFGDDFEVREDLRQRGYGRALLSAAEASLSRVRGRIGRPERLRA